MTLVLRATFALAALVVVVWLLRGGEPFGAGFVVIAAIVLRRAVESGRLQRAAAGVRR